MIAVGVGDRAGLQERCTSHTPVFLFNGLQSKEAQHAADMKRLAQHYQAQLAAAEGEIQKAREAQVSCCLVAGGEVLLAET